MTGSEQLADRGARRRRVSFTKRHDFHVFRKRQELSKTPNTTAVANVERRLPRSPKLAQGISIDNRISQDNVEQSPATRTRKGARQFRIRSDNQARCNAG